MSTKQQPAAPTAIETYLAQLDRSVQELEALATTAATGASPDLGAAIMARAKAAELSKKVAQIRTWLERQPAPESPPPVRKGRSAKWGTAVVLIASGRSITETARDLGVDRRTVTRWRAEPEFGDELQELQEAQASAVHALLVAKQLEVVRCLAAVATAPDTSDVARVGAARVFFELLGKHKGAPVTPPIAETGLETEEEVVAVLGQYPAELLEAALAAQRKERDL